MALITNIKSPSTASKKLLDKSAKEFFKDYILSNLFDKKVMDYSNGVYDNLYNECFHLYNDNREVLIIDYNSKYKHILFNFHNFNPNNLYKICGIKEVKFRYYKNSYSPINMYLDENDAKAGTFGDFFKITTENFDIEYGIRIMLNSGVHKKLTFGKGNYFNNTCFEEESGSNGGTYIKKILQNLEKDYQKISRPFIGNGIVIDFDHDINKAYYIKDAIKLIDQPYDGLRGILKELPIMVPLNISIHHRILLIKFPEKVSYDDRKSMVRLYKMQENGIWNGGYIESFILDGFKYILIEKDY